MNIDLAFATKAFSIGVAMGMILAAIAVQMIVTSLQVSFPAASRGIGSDADRVPAAAPAAVAVAAVGAGASWRASRRERE